MENNNLKKVKVLIARSTLTDSLLMECDIENVFSGFHLAVFKEMESGYNFKVFISVYDTEDRLVCGDTCDLNEISNSHFRLQTLTNKIKEIIVEAKKIKE